MMRVQDLQLAPIKPPQNCFLENSQEKNSPLFLISRLRERLGEFFRV